MCICIGDSVDTNTPTIYKIQEPSININDNLAHLTKYTKGWSKTNLRYPPHLNVQNYDAGSMVIDANRHEIVIFTKSWSSYGCKVFKGKYMIKQDKLQ